MKKSKHQHKVKCDDEGKCMNGSDKHDQISIFFSVCVLLLNNRYLPEIFMKGYGKKVPQCMLLWLFVLLSWWWC